MEMIFIPTVEYVFISQYILLYFHFIYLSFQWEKDRLVYNMTNKKSSV